MYSGYTLAAEIYWWIYSFHMPAFIYIAGYFSKGFLENGYIKRLFIKTMIPGWIFSMIYGVLNEHIHGWITVNPLIYPGWISWFLFSLFLWNLLLQIFGRYKLITPIAFILPCLIVILDETGYLFSINRTLFFFPFFLIGFHTKRKHIDIITSHIGKIVSVFLVLLIYVTIKNLQIFTPSHVWFYGYFSNDFLQVDNLRYLLLMYSIYPLMFLMMFSVLSFIPQREFLLTSIGKYTMFIYLLHGVLVKIILWKGFFVYNNTPGTIVYLAILSLTLCLVLSSEVTRKIMSPLIDIKYK